MLKRFSCAILVVCATVGASGAQTPSKRPNVIVVIADDMGHGDLGCHGNPKIKTPNLDKLARDGTRFEHFYVSPVCAPTRASLLTGRYNYRTGVVDTFIGRAMMHTDEVTLAEMLRGGGYRTAIFGKWHLGDNYPMRPIDQGFHEVLVHKGGGIGQPSDPPAGNSYFDPFLEHNGKTIKAKGYCSDVYTDAAMNFVTKNRDGPFFVYLAYNCPHAPLQVPPKYQRMYDSLNLGHGEFPNIGQPLPGKAQQDVIAKVYGMVTNIDDNLGRLFAKLEELRIADNTIVVFLTDNGPQQVRYNSGMLGRKGSVHEGGTRVPFFIRWAGKIAADKSIDRIAAHIDVVPTVLEACGVKQPAKVKMDGLSLWPLVMGKEIDWPDRTIYMQWHRGDVPELGRACAARSQRWRLVQPDGANDKKKMKPAKFQLYDIAADPFQKTDLADKHSDVVARMRKGYESWFKDVSGTRGYDPPRIHLGSPEENPVELTRQDWRGPRAGWGADSLGHWEVHVTSKAAYDVKLLFAAQPKARVAHFSLGGVALKKEVPADATEVVFAAVALADGPGRLEAWLALEDQTVGVQYVIVQRRD